VTLNERAEKARTTLFSRYDQLNALWLQAEKELAKLHIPHPVCFC
jgi:ribosomal protein L32